MTCEPTENSQMYCKKMLDIATITAETLLLEFNTKKSVCIAFGPRIPDQLPSMLLSYKLVFICVAGARPGANFSFSQSTESTPAPRRSVLSGKCLRVFA